MGIRPLTGVTFSSAVLPLKLSPPPSPLGPAAGLIFLALGCGMAIPFLSALCDLAPEDSVAVADEDLFFVEGEEAGLRESTPASLEEDADIFLLAAFPLKGAGVASTGGSGGAITVSGTGDGVLP